MADKKDNFHDIMDNEESSTTTGDCHWFIQFDVLIPELSEEEKINLIGPTYKDGDEVDPWLSDEIMLQGGDDAMDAVRWIQKHVTDKELYGLPVIGFKLKGITLVSQADMVIGQ